jgi:hypothetical protein
MWHGLLNFTAKVKQLLILVMYTELSMLNNDIKMLITAI